MFRLMTALNVVNVTYEDGNIIYYDDITIENKLDNFDKIILFSTVQLLTVLTFSWNPLHATSAVCKRRPFHQLLKMDFVLPSSNIKSPFMAQWHSIKKP